MPLCATAPQRPWLWAGWLALFVTWLLPAGAQGQGYTLNRARVSGGGGLSTGGSWALVSTLGQAEAGQMNGGTYSLTGGFLPALGMTQTNPPPPVQPGFLSGSLSVAASAVDLTAEGASDWVHWGSAQGVPKLDRKAGVPSLISDFVPVLGPWPSTPVPYASQSLFYWSDGQPDVSGEDFTLDWTLRPGNGFAFVVSASPALQVLWVHTAASQAAVHFAAWLGDDSAPMYVNESRASDLVFQGEVDAVYTVVFAAASPGQVLHILYYCTDGFANSDGAVGLGAASLSSMSLLGAVPPTPRLVPPSGGAPGRARIMGFTGSGLRLDFAGIPGRGYAVQRAADAAFTQNVTTLLATNAPATGAFTVWDPAPPATAAFYRLKAR